MVAAVTTSRRVFLRLDPLSHPCQDVRKRYIASGKEGSAALGLLGTKLLLCARLRTTSADWARRKSKRQPQDSQVDSMGNPTSECKAPQGGRRFIEIRPCLRLPSSCACSVSACRARDNLTSGATLKENGEASAKICQHVRRYAKTSRNSDPACSVFSFCLWQDSRAFLPRRAGHALNQGSRSSALSCNSRGRISAYVSVAYTCVFPFGRRSLVVTRMDRSWCEGGNSTEFGSVVLIGLYRVYSQPPIAL